MFRKNLRQRPYNCVAIAVCDNQWILVDDGKELLCGVEDLVYVYERRVLSHESGLVFRLDNDISANIVSIIFS